METYNGHVRTPTDAIILFEACRLGLLPRVQRRLSEKERQSIRSGSVFVWDEREAGMRRWTDGKSWSASRVSGSFLTYREMEGKRGSNTFVPPPGNRGTKTPDSGRNSAEDPAGADSEEGPDGYRYKPDGLMKQSFSITTSQGQHLHLISYYSRSHPAASNLRQPSNDPTCASIQIPKGMYPESTVNDQSNTPAVTRSPMPGAPNYVMAPSPTYNRPPPPPPPPHTYFQGYLPHAYVYPISPMHTPPGPYAFHPYAQPPGGLPPPGYAPPPFVPAPYPPLSLANAQRQWPSVALDSKAPPPTLQHSVSAPAPNSLPLPQSSQPPPLPSPTSTQAPATASENWRTTQQIDPRLHDARTSMSDNVEANANGRSNIGSQQGGGQTSQTPTIGALINGPGSAISTASGAPPQLPTTSTREEKGERLGSKSPGDKALNVPPQDIPSEKLGFREDKRALSKLDRVFAKV